MADWSNAEIEQARKYFAQGMNCSMIGRQIGRSRNAVIGKLARIGLSSAVQPTLRKPRARRLGGVAERTLVINARRKKAAATADGGGAFEFDHARFVCKPAPGYPGKPLLELAANECHYPIDPTAAELRVLFCAAPTMGAGMSWCRFHSTICCRPPPPREPARLPVSRSAPNNARASWPAGLGGAFSGASR